ncbi:MAG: LysE family transporter, partial [Flavobacteriaceae bacterium]
MDYPTLLLFIFSSVLLTLSPGPDILFVISSSLAKGWRKGVQLTLGLTSGILIHTSVVVFGVGSMLNAYPQVLRLIEIAGGSYLIFLALRLLK